MRQRVRHVLPALQKLARELRRGLVGHEDIACSGLQQRASAAEQNVAQQAAPVANVVGRVELCDAADVGEELGALVRVAQVQLGAKVEDLELHCWLLVSKGLSHLAQGVGAHQWDDVVVLSNHPDDACSRSRHLHCVEQASELLDDASVRSRVFLQQVADDNHRLGHHLVISIVRDDVHQPAQAVLRELWHLTRASPNRLDRGGD
mmetsp:Transcript_16342/g.38404  ORF Transcript_16342/g.38404 Transcript_16342/m.38404 type:complete len:205 (-) Transcript_16342:1403-2017(-)